MYIYSNHGREYKPELERLKKERVRLFHIATLGCLPVR